MALRSRSRLLALAIASVVVGSGAQLSFAEPVAHTVVVPMVASDKDIVLLEGPTPYSAGLRTGVPQVDAVLEALESNSPEALRALLEPLPAPCVINPQFITNPPLCPEGVSAGALVPVFRATACESVWPDYLQDLLAHAWSDDRPLLAVYREPTDAYSWLPAADYAILVSRGERGPAQSWPFVVRVRAGRVTGIAFGCGQSFAKLTAGIEPGRYVVSPLNWP